MFKCFALFLVVALSGFYADAADIVKDGIKIPDGNNLKLTVHAIGDQIFKCLAANGGYKWQWQAPDAILYDMDTQTQVGMHSAGPSWTYQDGSSIKGQMLQKIDAPDPDAAPWLLLEGKEQGGQGLLTHISFILRFNTKGGLPPDASRCDKNNAGKESRIAYSADYSFFGQ
jgi:hypothetical protein